MLPLRVCVAVLALAIVIGGAGCGSEDGRPHTGSGDRVVLSFDTLDGCPAWSSDGSALAVGGTRDVLGGSDVHVVDRAGKRLRRLTATEDDEAVLSWVGGSNRIVFARHGLDVFGVYAINTHGGMREKLLRRLDGSEEAVSISPDGQRLAAFVNLGDTALYGDDELRLVDVATGKRRTLATGFVSPEEGVAFAPDSTRLAYVAKGDVVTVVDLETGKRQAVGGVTSTPVWSPDGSRLAVAEHSGGTSQVHVGEVGPKVSVTRALTDRGDAENRPLAFSRDGRTVVYQNGADLRAVDIDGGRDRLIADGEGESGCPAFSPDGRRMAFTRETAAASELVIMDVEDASPDG